LKSILRISAAALALISGCASAPRDPPPTRNWLYFPEARVYAPAPPSFFARSARGWLRQDYTYEPLDGDAPLAIEDPHGEPWSSPRPVPGRGPSRVVHHEWVVYKKASAYYCRLHGHYVQQTDGLWVEVRGSEEALAAERPRALLGYHGPAPWEFAPP
jgi:hypothetical protein